MVTVPIAFLGGLVAYAGCYKLIEYFRNQQQQRLASNPLFRQVTSHTNHHNDPNNGWVHYQQDMWHDLQHSNTQNTKATTNLQFDTENTMNIAVCGNSGTGKSTFINCVRGIPDVEIQPNFIYKQDGPAPVGIMETTQKIMSYQWPHNHMPHLTLWDLPCASTIPNPDKTYFNKLQLHRFDCLLLFRAGRFTEFDAAICQQALKHKLPIVLVLNKSDQDVINYKKMKIRKLGRQLTEDEFQQVISQTISVLKSNALSELQSIPTYTNIDSHHIPIFVIAPQSYRDQLHNVLDSQDCPPLETQDLLNYCINIVIEHRKNQDEQNN